MTTGAPEILALLDNRLATQLRSVVGGRAILTTVSSLDKAKSALDSRRLSGIVFSPFDANGDSAAPLNEYAQARHPALPRVVYATIGVEEMRETVRIAKQGIGNIVLSGYDDGPSRLTPLLEHLGMIRIDHPEIVVPPAIIRVGDAISLELIREIAAKPSELEHLLPRRFEELVADLLRRQGFEVQTTSETRDGGKDIVVRCRTPLGTQVYYVECKRYALDRRVGVPLVRELYGAVQADRVTGGILATSSYFTRDALAYQAKVPYQLTLRDNDDLRRWLDVAATGTGSVITSAQSELGSGTRRDCGNPGRSTRNTQ